MIVVDTNIIAYLWLPGEFSPLAEKLLQKDSHWVSSILWKSEFRNVVASFFRKGKISYDSAIDIIFAAEEQMENQEYSINSLKVMEKVKESKCSAYDCEYVALAESLDCNLITNDQEIIKAFPKIARDIKKIL